jgi:hypothetical protein
MAVVINPPSRNQIAKIAGNDPELVRALERLFLQALNLTPTEIDDVNAAINRIIENVKFISSQTDLPDAVGGVITLEAGKTYFITTDIDLTGDRLETGGVVTILGTSSETASITSTGLGVGVPLLTSRYTMPVRFITFKDVDTAIYIDDAGINGPVALDWYGVNFLNVTTVGEIGDVDNFVYDTGAFLGSQGMTFTGSIGTAAFSNSLFRGDGSAANIISIEATATITRRFRIIYSSVVAFGSAVGISASTSATIPVEGFILDTVNFSGGSTYVTGVQQDDDKANWSECRGVRNSAAISSYYMNGNTTATTIATIGVAVKAAGTTTSAPISQRFTNTANRATYDGAIQRDFKVSAVLSCNSGNNNIVGIYIAKNGTLLPESEVYITANAGGRAEGASCQVIVAMVETDYIEIWVENDTSTTDVTVSELNVIVEALN